MRTIRVELKSFRLVLSIAAIVSGLLTQGCMEATILGYQPLTRGLDGKNELHISTYPAGFPKKTSSVPFLYKALSTPESVYFQVFVRAEGNKAGPNPNIESILIRSLSYQLPGQEPVELLSDFPSYFWMQGNPEDNPGERTPVPFLRGGALQLRIELTVNGRDYRFDERMEATESRTSRPLLLHALS